MARPAIRDDLVKKLFAACESGDKLIVDQLISGEPEVRELLVTTNSPDNKSRVGEKTIYVACQRGHYDVVKSLVNAGVNVNSPTNFGTPLSAATKSGNLILVKYLVGQGADFHTQHGHFNPLFLACVEGKLEILKYLITLGADVNSFTNPPLIFTACAAGHLPVLKYLMDYTKFSVRQTINGKDCMRTDGKDTLLHKACQMKKLDIAEYLVRAGSPITHTIVLTAPDIIGKVLSKRIVHSSRPPTATKDDITYVQAKWQEMGLAHLNWSFFSGFTEHLSKIVLRDNQLILLPPEIFSFLPQLRILDVAKNQLSELALEDVPWKCQFLMEVDISHNKLTFVPSSLFKLPELLVLNISFNLLRTLPGDPEDPSAAIPGGMVSDIVWDCRKLKRLDLSHNHLNILPDMFSNLQRLTTLNVGYNNLEVLPQTLCWYCNSLTILEATHNKLVDLPMGTAQCWTSLEKLSLAHNLVAEISTNMSQLTQLTSLDVSHNHIHILPHTDAWNCGRLVKLNLSHNKLVSISHEERSTSVSQTTNTHNKESVTLKIRHMFKGQRARPSPAAAITTTLAPVDGVCRDLPYEMWSSSLHSLYLNDNNLESVPEKLGNLSALTRLDLSNNFNITELPLELGKLQNCWELSIKNLKIANVPQHVRPDIRGGTTRQLLAYLRAQLRRCVPYNRMKLMVVGLQGRGKTTLLSVLRDPSAPLPENVSTVGVCVNEWCISKPTKKGAVKQEIRLSTWDLAGQEVYYATHQCFLSRNTLYLAVWNMEKGEDGIENLRPWLLNIQARAPHSPVIIVSTHLDKVPSNQQKEFKARYQQKIKELYERSGFPTIKDIIEVSAVTKDGIARLQEAILDAAVQATDPHTKEKVIGMMVPSSYVSLQQAVLNECDRLRKEDQPPVLSEEEFATLAKSDLKSDIHDAEELQLAAQFLHDNGILLHYNDHLRGLNNLYFIDPVWLCDMLAEVVTVRERHSFVFNGILRESNLPFIFRDSKRFPSKFFPQYLQLLERFEIALSLGDKTRLIPSMLPLDRPAMNFEPTFVPAGVRAERSFTYITKSKNMPKQLMRKTVSAVDTTRSVAVKSSGSDSSAASIHQPGEINSVRRRYKMAYIPSGFWSRLISRLMINLRRAGISMHSKKGECDTIYWRRGIAVFHRTGRFLVEAAHSLSAEIAGVCINSSIHLTRSLHLTSDGDRSTQGVDVTVWSYNNDFSPMGYIVDQIDALIDEWFPGLNDEDQYGNKLVERQVPWVVPARLCQELQDEPVVDDDDEEQVEKPREMHIFSLEDCAAAALMEDTIHCKEYDVDVPLVDLVPDLLMTDLPQQWHLDISRFEFNPTDISTRLGAGGAGAVYKGRYCNEVVAVKQFLTANQVDIALAESEGAPLPPEALSEEYDVMSTEEALYLFRDLRQEVTVLAQLDHPYVVSLLGVSVRPMCLVLELAPMGSLFGILDKKITALKEAQEDRVGSSLHMPGGVLGYVVSYRIALQVILALRYLHSQRIIYRDLKSDNVLVWSLDPSEVLNIKLADYGISRFANPSGVKGQEGTPGYVAPEALRRRGEDQAFDEKVDIFSYAMVLYELLTGARPFEDKQNVQEISKAITTGNRPELYDFNTDPAFSSMVHLMYDCWRQAAIDRPTADQVVQYLLDPSFLCRKHILLKAKEHPLQKIDTIFAMGGTDSNHVVWTWARQDVERNFSILDADKGIFTVPERPSAGGRVFCMTSTGEMDKRIWIGTADHEIQVFGTMKGTDKDAGYPKCLWSYSMRDSVLALSTQIEGGRVKCVLASLANGSLCLFYRKSITGPVGPKRGSAVTPTNAATIVHHEEKFRSEADEWATPLVLQVSEDTRAAKCMVFVGDNRMWCGCGNSMTVVDTVELNIIKTFTVFVRRNSFVYELQSNGKLVWGIGRQLSFVMEWDAETYQLLHVFDCQQLDPTSNFIHVDPSKIDAIDAGGNQPNEVTGNEDSPTQSPVTTKKLDISNEPSNASRFCPFSRENTIKSLANTKNSEMRLRTKVITSKYKKDSPSLRPRLSSRTKALRKFAGSTRATSLVLVKDTLWIGRGMGDIIIIDIGTGQDHGRVLARLCDENSEKYGNRSGNKLVVVDDKYVVSSQWLEPSDMQKGSSDSGVSSHQQITVWEAWDKAAIEAFHESNQKMLDLETPDNVN